MPVGESLRTAGRAAHSRRPQLPRLGPEHRWRLWRQRRPEVRAHFENPPRAPPRVPRRRPRQAPLRLGTPSRGPVRPRPRTFAGRRQCARRSDQTYHFGFPTRTSFQHGLGGTRDEMCPFATRRSLRPAARRSAVGSERSSPTGFAPPYRDERQQASSRPPTREAWQRPETRLAVGRRSRQRAVLQRELGNGPCRLDGQSRGPRRDPGRSTVGARCGASGEDLAAAMPAWHREAREQGA